MKCNNYEVFRCLLPFSRYKLCRQPDFPFARFGLWRIFWNAIQDSRFAFHSSRIVNYAQVQRCRHSLTGVFYYGNHNFTCHVTCTSMYGIKLHFQSVVAFRRLPLGCGPDRGLAYRQVSIILWCSHMLSLAHLSNTFQICIQLLVVTTVWL